LEYAEIGTDGTGMKTNNAGSYRITKYGDPDAKRRKHLIIGQIAAGPVSPINAAISIGPMMARTGFWKGLRKIHLLGELFFLQFLANSQCFFYSLAGS